MSDLYDPNSHDYRQFRRNVVQDAIDKVFKPAWKPDRHNPIDELFAKADKITQQVRAKIVPILKAGGDSDRAALQSMISILYTEAFAKDLTKEEALTVLVIMHTEIALANIERDHWGLNKPDGIEPDTAV